jgi:hypothetical protein
MSLDAMMRLSGWLRAAVFAFAVAAVALTPVAVAGDSSKSGFGQGGWTSTFESVTTIAPQANGKIVLVDWRGEYWMRLLADGRIDRSFGAAAGRVNGGPRRFGFDPARDGQLTPRPAEVEVARLIFELAREGRRRWTSPAS